MSVQLKTFTATEYGEIADRIAKALKVDLDKIEPEGIARQLAPLLETLPQSTTIKVDGESQQVVTKDYYRDLLYSRINNRGPHNGNDGEKEFAKFLLVTALLEERISSHSLDPKKKGSVDLRLCKEALQSLTSKTPKKDDLEDLTGYQLFGDLFRYTSLITDSNRWTIFDNLRKASYPILRTKSEKELSICQGALHLLIPTPASQTQLRRDFAVFLSESIKTCLIDNNLAQCVAPSTQMSQK